MAVSMGDTVINRDMPFIWEGGKLPWHCTNHSKLKITCPEKFRIYANRVDQNVPIWRENVTIGAYNTPNAVPNFLTGAPAEPVAAYQEDDAESDNDELNVPDAPLADEGDDDDPSVRFRSMSRAALKAEAQTLQHRMSHFPHNPFCQICCRAHMRQRRYARRTDPSDDQLEAPDAPLQQISSDSLIISKSHREDDKLSAAGNATVHTIRDLHSGCSLAVPLREHGQEAMYRNFKFFAGLKAKDPNILVRSDAAREITNAVRELGWHAEPSLENKWPHNAAHERYQGVLKSVTRAGMLQSGFPRKAWDLCISYCSVALPVTQLAPIHSWEKDAAGNVLDAHKI